jgi:hypothetical protein
MLILSYLGEAGAFDLTTGINLLAVRNPPKDKIGKHLIPPHFGHLPELSPSPSLFGDTQLWKNEYGKEKENWWHLYEPRFIREMQERVELIRALRWLEWLLKEGIDIRVFCFCKDVDGCHRGLVGNEMIRRGCEVDFRRIGLSTMPVLLPTEIEPLGQLTLF